jgi:hypothetical protein
MWNKFPETKPLYMQPCIVAANGIAQILAVVWDGEEFKWFDEELCDPYPSEVTTHWMPFPNDPK